MNRLTEEEIISVWNMIFNLSLHMLHDRNDAEDAVQKIFVRLLEKDDLFGESASYSTWAYRVAYNCLIDEIRRRKTDRIRFDEFEQDIRDRSLYNDAIDLNSTELKIYTEQVKAGCSMAMLQCLKPEERYIYILGTVFRFPGRTAAEICGKSYDAYRQALSRSTKKIHDFVGGICGHVNPQASCRCRKRIRVAMERGRIDPMQLQNGSNEQKIREITGEMENLDEISRLFQSNSFVDVRELYFSRMKVKYGMLQEK